MKKVFYAIIALVALYLVLALFGPKEIRAERSIVINASVDQVRSRLGDFVFFHDKWSPWTHRDPNMKTEYSGEAGKPGHKHKWSGNSDVGAGEMELVAVGSDTIIQRMRFEGESRDARAYYIVKSEEGGTRVTWGMQSEIGFLHRAPMLFINVNDMIGKDFEEGLQNLKTAIESESPETSYEIKEQKWGERTFLSTRKATLRGDQCGPFLAENLPKLYADLGKMGLQSPMAPSMIFYSWDEKTMMTECVAAMAVPTDDKTVREKINKLPWDKCVVPASSVLHIAYYGDYGQNMDAHVAMEKYIAEKGLKKDLVIEEYVTDPMVVKDTTQWLTNIYYVLK